MKVIVVGGGKVGTYLANLLLENNCIVKVIENRDSVIANLKKELPADSIVIGSGTDPNILELAGITDADVVATVTGADETNLVAATIAKFEFGVPRVIARVNNPKNAWLFNISMGVDASLNQADFMAHLVLEEIDLKNVMMLLKLNRGDYSIIQVNVDAKSEAVNKAVKDLSIPKTAVLISIYRDKDVIIPRGDTIILGGDTILLFTAAEAQSDINKLFGSKM